MDNAEKAWERWWSLNKETPVPYGTFDKLMQKLFTEGFDAGNKEGYDHGFDTGYDAGWHESEYDR